MVDLAKGWGREPPLCPALEEGKLVDGARIGFLSRVSHELRTPLHAILGFAQLLESNSPRDDQRENLDQILKAGRRLLELVDKLLDLSRLEAGRLELAVGPVSARAVVAEALERVQPLAARRMVRLCSSDSAEDGLYLLADGDRLGQVVESLLVNGVQYNCEGGVVTVAWERAVPGRLRLTVSDTGPGIAPERMGRLFTPFDRLGAERTEVEGAGLELALARRLVEAMRGTLTVESAVGQGSRFCIELPLAGEPAETKEGDG